MNKLPKHLPDCLPQQLPTALPMRRRMLGGLLLAALLGACALPPSAPPAGEPRPPIVFVHGNGDSAAQWMPTVWRWESNGWPRERLHAVDLAYPSARTDDTVEQAGRSSTEDQRAQLAAEIERVLAATGSTQVVLIGNSRGGNAIRHYIASGGAAKVSHAILGGTPSHGVWVDAAYQPNNEFNGAGPFLATLNAPKGPEAAEVTPGVRWLTLRSDRNDKYAQPDGVWIGRAGVPTNIGFDGPALKGATNRVLPERDHREVSYHPEAFAAAWQFVTGHAPATAPPTHVLPQARITLAGLVSGYTAAGPTNLPLPGARLTVHAVDAATGARLGAPLLSQTIAAGGRWGPLATDSSTALEFVLEAPGYATTHLYRSPFARSSDIVHLRPERALAEADRDADALIVFSRPRAYFGLPRDHVLIDGQPAPGIPPGVAGLASARLKLKGGAADIGRPVAGDFRSGVIAERIVGRSWPARDGQVSVLELHE